MPLPTEALDAQQAVILAKQLVLGTAIAADQAASDASTVAAVLAARQALGREVAKLPLILIDADGYHPPGKNAELYDLVYQVAYALAPAF